MELVAAEKHQQEALKVARDRNKTLSMLDEILEDVRKAADRLEEDIEEHAFDNNKQVQAVKHSVIDQEECLWTWNTGPSGIYKHRVICTSDPRYILQFTHIRFCESLHRQALFIFSSSNKGDMPCQIYVYIQGIFVAIDNNTLYGSKLYIFILCQKLLDIKIMFH